MTEEVESRTLLTTNGVWTVHEYHGEFKSALFQVTSNAEAGNHAAIWMDGEEIQGLIDFLNGYLRKVDAANSR